MAESWDHVPEFQPTADKRHILANINTDEGFQYSVMTLDRAEEVAAEIRALGDKLVASGVEAVGYPLQWVAADLVENVTKARAPATEEKTDG